MHTTLCSSGAHLSKRSSRAIIGCTADATVAVLNGAVEQSLMQMSACLSQPQIKVCDSAGGPRTQRNYKCTLTHAKNEEEEFLANCLCFSRSSFSAVQLSTALSAHSFSLQLHTPSHLELHCQLCEQAFRKGGRVRHQHPHLIACRQLRMSGMVTRRDRAISITATRCAEACGA